MGSAGNPMSTVPSGEVNDRKILISDQTNKFQFKTQPTDCFIIDVDNSNGTSNQISQNFKITRNLSRKSMLIIRGGNKMGEEHGGGDGTGKSVSPIDSVVVGGSREEHDGGGSSDDGNVSHEIMITSGIERLGLGRSSFKRSSQACTWYLDPRNIVLFCATLSCLGTMVLIYLAISSGITNVQDSNLDS